MKQKGFTLVELIVVVVILGILSIVAVPKFMNFERDANIAALKGIKGSLETAFFQFKAKTYLPSADLSETPHIDAKPSLYMTINGKKIRYTNSDHMPWFVHSEFSNINENELILLKAILDTNIVPTDDEGQMKISFDCSNNGGFYIFPKSASDVGLQCDETKQCYLEYHPQNSAHDNGKSKFILKTRDC